MKKIILALAAALGLTLILLSCSKSEDNQNPAAPVVPDPINLIRESSSGSISARAASGKEYLHITFNPPMVSSSCYDSILYSSSDDTLDAEYVLSGNTLTMYLPNSEGDLDTSEFTRTSTGTGLVGTWVIEAIEPFSKTLDTLSETVTFNADSTFTRNAARKINFVNCYREEWLTNTRITNSSLTLDTVNVMTLNIKGNITQELVTVTMKQNQDILFTSTDTSHHSHTHYFAPTVCPNSYEPAWIESLLIDNPK